jgi:short-subunit dehydrogenase
MNNPVLILGALSDVGTALARRFAQSGYPLIVAARQLEAAQNLAADITIRYGVAAKACYFDALAYDTHADFWQQLNPQPSTVIAVFGYLGNQEEAAHNFAEAQRIIHTNYTGAVSILNIVAQSMEQAKSGCIVGISSVAGERGRQSNYIYGSAKAAFTAYLSGLRNRLAHSGAHVLTVKPGFIATKMTEHLTLPPLLTASPQQVANDVFKAVQKRSNVIYTLWMWRWIMLIIKLIPESIFKKLKM